MSDPKVVSLQQYKTSQKRRRLKGELLQNLQENKKMFFLVIIASIIVGAALWNFLIEHPARLDVQIPASNNITFNHEEPVAMTASQVASEFGNYEGKTVLLYIYTTWCSSCAKQFPVINEVAREFQNTDLQIMALAIDRDLTAENVTQYFNRYGDLYFQPRYLSHKDGFIDFLKKRNISYQGRIPYTVLISQEGDVVTKFVGAKSHNYLRNKIIREIYQ